MERTPTIISDIKNPIDTLRKIAFVEEIRSLKYVYVVAKKKSKLGLSQNERLFIIFGHQFFVYCNYNKDIVIPFRSIAKFPLLKYQIPLQDITKCGLMDDKLTLSVQFLDAEKPGNEQKWVIKFDNKEQAEKYTDLLNQAREARETELRRDSQIFMKQEQGKEKKQNTNAKDTTAPQNLEIKLLGTRNQQNNTYTESTPKFGQNQNQAPAKANQPPSYSLPISTGRLSGISLDEAVLEQLASRWGNKKSSVDAAKIIMEFKGLIKEILTKIVQQRVQPRQSSWLTIDSVHMGDLEVILQNYRDFRSQSSECSSLSVVCQYRGYSAVFILHSPSTAQTFSMKPPPDLNQLVARTAADLLDRSSLNCYDTLIRLPAQFYLDTQFIAHLYRKVSELVSQKTNYSAWDKHTLRTLQSCIIARSAYFLYSKNYSKEASRKIDLALFLRSFLHHTQKDLWEGLLKMCKELYGLNLNIPNSEHDLLLVAEGLCLTFGLEYSNQNLLEALETGSFNFKEVVYSPFCLIYNELEDFMAEKPGPSLEKLIQLINMAKESDYTSYSRMLLTLSETTFPSNLPLASCIYPDQVKPTSLDVKIKINELKWLLRDGRETEALKLMDQAIRTLQKAVPCKNESYSIDIWAVVGRYFYHHHRLSDAVLYLQIAKQRVMEVSPHSEQHADILDTLAQVYKQLRNYDEVASSYNALKSMIEYRGIEEDLKQTYAQVMLNLGHIYIVLQKFDEAMQQVVKAQQIFLELHQEDSDEAVEEQLSATYQMIFRIAHLSAHDEQTIFRAGVLPCEVLPKIRHQQNIQRLVKIVVEPFITELDTEEKLLLDRIIQNMGINYDHKVNKMAAQVEINRLVKSNQFGQYLKGQFEFILDLREDLEECSRCWEGLVNIDRTAQLSAASESLCLLECLLRTTGPGFIQCLLI